MCPMDNMKGYKWPFFDSFIKLRKYDILIKINGLSHIHINEFLHFNLIVQLTCGLDIIY